MMIEELSEAVPPGHRDGGHRFRQDHGPGARHHSDQVAVEAMRTAMDTLPMRGEIVIGEGERDEAPMLFIGEHVGRGRSGDPEVGIAVTTRSGEQTCARSAPPARSRCSRRQARGCSGPHCYMEDHRRPGREGRDPPRRVGLGGT